MRPRRLPGKDPKADADTLWLCGSQAGGDMAEAPARSPQSRSSIHGRFRGVCMHGGLLCRRPNTLSCTGAKRWTQAEAVRPWPRSGKAKAHGSGRQQEAGWGLLQVTESR